MEDGYWGPCQGPDFDGWEYTHAWVSGVMYVNGGDVAEVSESRPDVDCEACGRLYVDVAAG